MLFKLQNNIFIVGLLSIGFMAIKVYERAFCLITIVTLIAFVSQMCLLLYFSREKERNYSESTLFWTTFFYSLICGSLFMSSCYLYDGDTFMFTKKDAMIYYRESMNVTKVGMIANVKQIMEHYEFDDWGSLTFDSFMMYIIPDKFFLNLVYMLTGSLSGILLFRIGKYLMPLSYAFLSAITYSTSSYLICFHCTFLKESLFVFLVICAMYFFYKVIGDGLDRSFVGVGLSLLCIMFFRPAVGAFMIISFFTYYAVTQRGAISLFLYMLIFVALVVSLTALQGMVDNYTGGDMDNLVDYGTKGGYSSSFSYFVSIFGALFGPFPSLFPKEEGVPLTINYYGAGLTYRLFLVYPLWIGVFWTIKKFVSLMIPITAFVLVEMLSTGFVMASLELRKVILHVPFMYVLAFFGLHRWHTEKGLEHLSESMLFTLAVGILVLWNIFRVS